MPQNITDKTESHLSKNDGQGDANPHKYSQKVTTQFYHGNNELEETILEIF